MMKKWVTMCILAGMVIGMVLMSGCTSSKSSVPSTSSSGSVSQQTGYQVRVIYSGSWLGSYGHGTSTKTISGTGTKTYDVPNPESVVMIDVMKRDDSSQRLTAEILKNGNVVKSDFTEEPHGNVAFTVPVGFF